jgi:2-phosphosulfolactate phosphatase
MMTALSHGATRIIPVAEISEALAIRAADPEVLLAGERDGVRILSQQSGGVDFDLGNSPREFTRVAVQGKTVVMTTTNGTRALRACSAAQSVYIGSFLGLGALADWLRNHPPAHLLLVCAGTYEEAAYEDTLAAGALADALWPIFADGHVADSTAIARIIYQEAASDLMSAMRRSRNGRRLLANPDLSPDVSVCARRDVETIVAVMTKAGVVQRL